MGDMRTADIIVNNVIFTSLSLQRSNLNLNQAYLLIQLHCSGFRRNKSHLFTQIKVNKKTKTKAEIDIDIEKAVDKSRAECGGTEMR